MFMTVSDLHQSVDLPPLLARCLRTGTNIPVAAADLTGKLNAALEYAAGAKAAE